ncbi:high mobility group box domain-containing protein [Sporodiniella umbellata]|nr:high mobility group box domain-containing protein [Sporodiniella umbellata]
MQQAYNMNVKEFLQRCQLSMYYKVLMEEGFETTNAIVEITEHDMIKMNIKRGHRRLIQREIATLRGLSPSQPLNTIQSIPLIPQRTSPSGSSGYESLVLSPPPASGNSSEESPVESHKRKYRRRPKPDTHAPLKPPSAYIAFSNAIRPELKHLKFDEISRKISHLWKNLSALDRQRYERRAMRAKDEYRARLERYKRTREYKRYQEYLKEFKRAKKRKSSSGSSSASLGDISSNGLAHSSISSSSSGGHSSSTSSGSLDSLPNPAIPSDPRMRGMISVELDSN